MNRGTGNHELYVAPSTPRSLAEYLLRQGVKQDEIESVIQCTVDDLSKVDYRLPINRYHGLWELAISFTDDPGLGLTLGAQSYKDDMGLLGHIFFNCPTLGDALKQYERYYSVVNEGMHVEVILEDDLVHLNYFCDDPQAYLRADMDRTLSISVIRAKQFISKNLRIEYVGFEHDPPEYSDRYAEIFPCPIYFSQSTCCLVFQRRFLDFRLPNRSTYLHRVLIKHLDLLLGKIRTKRPVSQRVRKIVQARLSRDGIDANAIAKKLNMSRNTLYRKLKNEGIAFHDLVDEVRKANAERYLIEGKHSKSEIAFLLGFSELSAFSRAFKRWHGCSPNSYLENSFQKNKQTR